MKIALYIEDGLEQIVLTPESDTEKGILEKLDDDSRELSIKHGSFYECQGGWTRHRQAFESIYDGSRPCRRKTGNRLSSSRTTEG